MKTYDLTNTRSVEQVKRALRTLVPDALPASDLDAPGWTRATSAAWAAFMRDASGADRARYETAGHTPTADGLALLAFTAEGLYDPDDPSAGLAYALAYWPALRTFAESVASEGGQVIAPAPARGARRERGVAIGSAVTLGTLGIGAAAGVALGAPTLGAAIGAGVGSVLGALTGALGGRR